MSGKYTLHPYHPDECMTLKEAARIARKSERTVRIWCAEFGLGRRVGKARGGKAGAGRGTWAVSKVALRMFLENDDSALASYADHGVRGSYEPVRKYYELVDLGDLLSLREFAI